MEVVKLFNSELSSLYETKPPISKAKMTSITRTAIKAIKFYKHVVQSVEKFIQKCKPEYKVPGLYVIDSIVRQSRHQFGTEKDVFAPRFARNLQQTFIHLFNCPQEDKSKVIRVLNLWQKNAVFDSDVIQPLFDLADPNHPIHKEQNATNTPSNGITTSKPPPGNVIAAKPPSGGKLGKEGTAGWLNQLNIDPSSASLQAPTSSLPMKQPPVPGQPAPGVLDMNFIQQLQQLQTLLLDQQQSDHTASIKKEPDQVKFDKKLLDFDYGEEEEEDNNAAPAPVPSLPQQQQQVAAGIDSLGSILSNPEVLRQLQNLQQQLGQQQMRQQQLELEEKVRRLQQMQQQEEEFDKHLAQTIPNLPFADECELKPGSDINSSVSLHQALVTQAQPLAFPGVDLNQPPPNYQAQMKPPTTSPLEDGERVNSDVDERTGRTKDNSEGGGAVVIIDSESPSESPARSHRRRRHSRSRSRSRRRSRSDSRSRSRSKRKRSRSNDKDHEKDLERSKQKEIEKEKERERRRKGLPTIKKNHLAVCSTTLWIGHLSKLVQQEELSDAFGEYGDIVSIDLIPPRGCAFICMNRRQDAHKALQHLKHHKLQGKAITLAWAPGKGMKGKEWKDYWEVDQGVSYIPWSKLTPDCDLELLEEGGMLDEETLPEWLKERQKKTREEQQQRQQQQSVQPDDGEDSQSSKPPPTAELDIPVPAPTLPGYIPLPDGPQPADIKSTQPPTIPPMMAPAPAPMPPLGMMPPFGLPNVSRLLGPMGMPMGPGLMPNVPLGVPPPGLMGNPLIHQQMMSRMPQPVGSPFSAPPGVTLMGGPHPPLSQIPLPAPGSSSQDKNTPTLPPLGVPPPSGDPSALTGFGDAMLQLPFTLPPQLQLQGLNVLSRPPILEQRSSPSTTITTTASTTTSDTPMETKDKPTEISTPTKGLNESVLTSMVNSQFLRPPPHFSPMTFMQIPPPMTILPPLVKTENSTASENSDNKSDRDSNKDKDYRQNLKDFRENDKDYRSKDREHDFRDKDYRDKGEKDYKDRDYRDRRDSRRDRNSRERAGDDKVNEDSRLEKETDDRKDFDSKKHDDGSRSDSKDDRGYRDRSRNRDRDRDRDRGRERSSRWSNRDREDKRNRDRNKGKDSQSEERDRATSSLQERLRSIAHDEERPGEFGRRGRSPGDQHQHSLLGHSPMFHPPPGIGEQSENVPFHGQRSGPNIGGPPMFGPRGTPNEDFREGFPPGPHDMHNRHQDDFGPRGPSRPGREGFDHRGPRGPPPDGFDHRGPPPDGFDHRGPPPDGFDPRGPPADEMNLRGPPHEGFDHRGPPPHDGFDHRGGPLGMPENFGPHGPPEDFHPRIRFEFFPRRGMGRPDFPPRMMGRGPMGPMFPRGHMGMRGPRPGIWLEGQGPSPQGGPGFPRGFPPPSEGHQSEEFFGRPPPFEDGNRGRGGTSNRGMRGRGFQSRQGDRRKEGQDRSEVKRSRWSNASPQPQDDHNQSSVPKLESSPETTKPPSTIKNEQNVGDNSEENKDTIVCKSEQPATSMETKQSSSSETQDTEKQSVSDNSVLEVAQVISPKSERWSSLSVFTPPERRSSTDIIEHTSSKKPERRSSLSASEIKYCVNEPERLSSFSGSETKSSATEPERRSSYSGPVHVAVAEFKSEPMEQDNLNFQEKIEKHFESSVSESSLVEQANVNVKVEQKNVKIEQENVKIEQNPDTSTASVDNTENKTDSSQTFEPSISSEQD